MSRESRCGSALITGVCWFSSVFLTVKGFFMDILSQLLYNFTGIFNNILQKARGHEVEAPDVTDTLNIQFLRYVAIVAMIILAIVVVAKLVGLVRVVLHPKRHERGRDGTRAFPDSLKHELSAKCGNRCENVYWWGGRCTYRGKLVGDHHYPHARGGATTRKNLVMLCPKCNSHKSAKIPSGFYTWRITRSRRGYGLEKPGEWRPYSYRHG